MITKIGFVHVTNDTIVMDRFESSLPEDGTQEEATIEILEWAIMRLLRFHQQVQTGEKQPEFLPGSKVNGVPMDQSILNQFEEQMKGSNENTSSMEGQTYPALQERMREAGDGVLEVGFGGLLFKAVLPGILNEGTTGEIGSSTQEAKGCGCDSLSEHAEGNCEDGDGENRGPNL
jgi:hypothetical protein